jgi:2-keto-4-pentenoate hydratase
MKKPSRYFAAAEALFAAHQRRARFEPLPPELAPQNAAEAYLIQDDFVAMRAQTLGGISGYKIALSTAAMRKFVGVDEPQAGSMLQRTLRRSPAVIAAADYVHLIVEFEIAVEIADDLPAADAPFTRERVAAAIGGVMPAIEIADDRNADYAALARQPLDLIADNCWNAGAVLGAPLRDWRGIDLAAVRGVARINGKEVGRGIGAEAMGHPLDAVAWVADNLASRERGMLRGDVVITGSLVTTKPALPGDRIEWSVDGLGSIELRVE